jgi:hypothetical protein
MYARAVNPTTAILQVNGTSYFKDEIASVSSLTTNMGLGSEAVLEGSKWYRTGAGFAGLNLGTGALVPTGNAGVNSNGTVSLGSASVRFNAGFFAGNVRIGSTTADDVQINGVSGLMFKNGMCGLRMVAGGLVPVTGSGTTGVESHNVYNLGTNARSWKDGFFGGTVYATKFVGDGSGLTNLPGGSGGGGSYTAGDGLSINNTTNEIKMSGAYPGTFSATEFVGGGAGLTGVTATDSRISNLQIQEWDEAHDWGNHADAGYAVGNLANYVTLNGIQTITGGKTFQQRINAPMIQLEGAQNTIYGTNGAGIHFGANLEGEPTVTGTDGAGGLSTVNLGRSSTPFATGYFEEVRSDLGVFYNDLVSERLVTTTNTEDTFLYATSPVGPTLFRHVTRGLEIDPMSDRMIVAGVIEANAIITDANSDNLLCANGTTVSQRTITSLLEEVGALRAEVAELKASLSAK